MPSSIDVTCARPAARRSTAMRTAMPFAAAVECASLQWFDGFLVFHFSFCFAIIKRATRDGYALYQPCAAHIARGSSAKPSNTHGASFDIGN
jgi:hypothetical protein